MRSVAVILAAWLAVTWAPSAAVAKQTYAAYEAAAAIQTGTGGTKITNATSARTTTNRTAAIERRRPLRGPSGTAEPVRRSLGTSTFLPP